MGAATRRGSASCFILTLVAACGDGAPQDQLSEASIVISPTAPRTGDELTASLQNAPENLEEGFWVWTRDGERILQLGASTVPALATAKGEVWRAAWHTDRLGPVLSSPVTIRNTAPQLEEVSLSPTDIGEASEVTCEPGDSVDADGDAIAYWRVWIVNGNEIEVADAVLTGENFSKGDEVACRLLPSDGEDAGDAVTSETAIVGNTEPSLAPTFDTDRPSAANALGVVLGEMDVDGDEVAVAYEWSVDGSAVSTEPTLDPSLFARGQSIRVLLTPSDADGSGEPVLLGPVVVQNAIPTLESVAIIEASARTSDLLTATGVAVDADGDEVTIHVDWLVDGALVLPGSNTLDGATHFDKGQSVVARLTPTDGTDVGSAVESAALVIENTPPTAVVSFGTIPEPGGTLVCEVETSDADGDAVTPSISWQENGLPYDGATETTNIEGDTIPNVGAAGTAWRCEVTADDGEDTSVSSEVFLVTGTRTFTSCGQVGFEGPSQAQCDSAYAGTLLEGTTVVGGIQSFVVPATGVYRIEAFGAQGASAESDRIGGRGARMRGDFSLTEGEELLVVVGQVGSVGSCNGGGGGASFVNRSGDPLIVAGGGGGTRASALDDGCDAGTAQQAGTGSGSSNFHNCALKPSASIGFGGVVSAATYGSGGGGWGGDGQADEAPGNGGRSLLGSALGGLGVSTGASGGFGGGGSGEGNCGGGGGGGYSGGDGGLIAGGGGSRNFGANPSNTAGAQSGPGLVTIERL